MTAIDARRATHPTAFDDLTTLIRVIAEGVNMKDGHHCIESYFWLDETIDEARDAGRAAMTAGAWYRDLALTEEQWAALEASPTLQKLKAAAFDALEREMWVEDAPGIEGHWEYPDRTLALAA